jgi:hypothetical protein
MNKLYNKIKLLFSKMSKNNNKNKNNDTHTIDICMSMIEHIDSFIRNTEAHDLGDFHPFIDEHDINIYKDIDKNTIISYTYGIFFKTNVNSKKINIFYTFLISYMLSVKLLTDCVLYKPYSFCLNMLREFDDLSKISNKLYRYSEYGNQKIIEKLKKTEWIILEKNNFFSQKDN